MEHNVKNTGKPYELLTQDVYKEILKCSGIKNIDVQQNVFLQGKTTKHLFDVFWKSEMAGLPFQVIIQAKDWKTKVPQKEMLAFAQILSDLPTGTRGVFITKTGYQSGAIDVAKANGISLYEFRKPDDKDWEGKMKDFHFDIIMKMPFCESLSTVVDESWVIQNNVDIKTGFKIEAHTAEMNAVNQNKQYINLTMLSYIIEKQMKS